MAIKIKGKEYPIRATMWALLEFKREKGYPVSELKDNNIEDLLYYTWLCVKSACRQADVEFDMSLEDYIAFVEDDPTEALVKGKLEEIKKKI